VVVNPAEEGPKEDRRRGNHHDLTTEPSLRSDHLPRCTGTPARITPVPLPRLSGIRTVDRAREEEPRTAPRRPRRKQQAHARTENHAPPQTRARRALDPPAALLAAMLGKKAGEP
jgi:hypothetical protein